MLRDIILAGSLFLAGASNALAEQIVVDNWKTNYSYSANYILTIDDNTAGFFNYTLTVNPWNAESSGLFLDLGDFDLPGDPFLTPSVLNLDSIDPAGEVVLFDYDVNSPNCGAGCSLSVLEPATRPYLDRWDGEWELIFRLGDSGFDNIQTFSFMTSDFGLTLDDFELAAVRANQFCHGDDLLPDDVRPCYWGNKAFAVTPNVSEPGAFILLALALGMFGYSNRKRG